MLTALVVFATDDKKLTTTLKRIGVTNIPAIEEVNMFKNDGEVIHFVGPKGENTITTTPWSLRSTYRRISVSLIGCYSGVLLPMERKPQQWRQSRYKYVCCLVSMAGWLSS